VPLSIIVNKLTLCHKGSSGVATATIPDVCKTPSPGGPVPIPYPNIAQSATLDKGTTTVKVDGGMMAAINGSEFSTSNGDEAGTAGGVTSSTFIKEATWMLYSFDVKLDGKEACRLTDKMFMNHQNTVCLAGEIQALLAAGMSLADACTKLFNDIEDLTGEGRTGHVNGVRGLEERRSQQIHGGGGGAAGAPNAPFDRGPNAQMRYPVGSNSWMRHDYELREQQNRLIRKMNEYDKECAGHGPPLKDSHYHEATTEAPAMNEWKGPWHPGPGELFPPLPPP
jgi:hypothetical protein